MIKINSLRPRRGKYRYVITIGLAVALVFILYQIYLVRDLSVIYNDRADMSIPYVRGTHITDKYKYSPDINGMFTCVKSQQVIDFQFVNDDYCDCEDNTDEPGTNACPDGVFYCKNSSTTTEDPIPSNRVNDGICDCCDGSDEYSLNPFIAKPADRVMCPNTCRP